MRCMSQTVANLSRSMALRCRCHNRPRASFAHGAGRRPSSKGCLQAPCCIDSVGRQPAHFCATPHDSFWQILLQKPSSTLLHLWCAAKDRLSDPDWLPSRNRVPEDPPREMLFYVFAERLCIEGSPGSFATQSPHIHRSWRRSDSVVFSCVDNLVGRRTLDHSGCGQNLIVATYQATRELPNLAR